MSEIPIAWAEPPPPDGLPDRLPDPFTLPPHPAAQRAARALQAELGAGRVAPGVSTQAVYRHPEGGKMFGVLWAGTPDGRVGLLKAYSGQVAGHWALPGWAPPVFDEAERDAVERPAEAKVKALTALLETLDAGPRRAAAVRLRRWTSRKAMRDIFDCYRFTQVGGASASLRSFFAPGVPPWGAGDCAAPKLLAYALRMGLRPLAMAEFWWGPPPAGGGRVEGAFYAPCEAKCRPLLPFLLSGL